MEWLVRPYHADDAVPLATFLSSYEWPFHGQTRRVYDDELEAVTGWWQVNSQIHLVVDDLGVIIGCMHLRELQDPIPELDIWVATHHQGRGVGTGALRWLNEHVFTTTDFRRIEGYTRVDNIPMRRAFEKAGWVCEGYHRQAWRGREPVWHDSLTFAVIKPDWQSGRVTPVSLPS